MIGFLTAVVVIMGLAGVLAGTSVLARSLVLNLLEPHVRYLPEPVDIPQPASLDREGAVALAALSSLKSLLVGILPSRWPR